MRMRQNDASRYKMKKSYDASRDHICTVATVENCCTVGAVVFRCTDTDNY